MKKLLAIFLIFALLPFAGCTQENTTSDKITVVATLFPQYDFVRQIGGDKVEVTLLLPPGQESHHYDPSPSDMVAISKSDLFIYTGDTMEPWAGAIASSVGDSVNIVNASENAVIDENSHREHEHALDPHIWLDFDNAKTMCDNILNALCFISPENKEYFTLNCESYKNELTALDQAYHEAFSSSDKTIVFGGKFALGYLVRKYNVSYKSAYDSCSANSEPSIEDIKNLSMFVKDNNTKVVYCEEYSDPKVAKEIASNNSALVLPIHSCHNLNKEDREAGKTFLSIMTENLENLRKGL